jgi:TolB-like protein
VVQGSSSSAGIFNSGMIFLADQLDRNVDPAFRSRPTVITSIASLANLNESSGLGRLVGEHLIHELQVRAWSVADIRLTRGLIVNNGGEFSLSRDMTQLRESFPIANIVTGTYSTTPDGVLLSVRVIDSSTGRVVSSGQTRFLRDRFIASLVDKPLEVPTIRLTAACPAGLVCGAGK